MAAWGAYHGTFLLPDMSDGTSIISSSILESDFGPAAGTVHGSSRTVFGLLHSSRVEI